MASNATLYCTVRDGDAEAACVYKPVAGERPLWDFPSGSLAGREVAAYHVSVAAGWHLVPPTIYRDGPFGPGMCQLWIESDETVDIIALARSHDHRALREMAVFDAVVNNADRKIGHLLPDREGKLFGCDHGVCFAEEYKLRTVLWQWRGRQLPTTAMEALPGSSAGWPAKSWTPSWPGGCPRPRSRPPGSGSTCCCSTASTRSPQKLARRPLAAGVELSSYYFDLKK